MGVMARYISKQIVEYIGDSDCGLIHFHLDVARGRTKYFDEDGKEISKPIWMNENPYKLVGLEN